MSAHVMRNVINGQLYEHLLICYVFYNNAVW